MRASYAKLLRGYALDALEQPVDVPVADTEFVQPLLERIVSAPRTPVQLVGLGQASQLASPRRSGTELWLGDELVALTIFPRT
jgi:hypothetical protein